MDVEKRTSTQDNLSYGSVLKDVVASMRSLIESEFQLMKAEAKETSKHVGQYAGRAALFGALLALSTLPFLAFLVIGLGRILDGNYWLSSLIVSLVCAAIGGTFAYRAYKKIKESDLSLPRTREGLAVGANVAQGKATEVKDVLTKDIAEITETGRRAS